MTMTIEPTTGPGEAIWHQQQPYITKLARDLARSFNHVVDEEDILQEIWVFLWQMEEQFITNNCRDVYIRTCIKNVAMNYALKQRNVAVMQTDTFFYAVEEVRELLPVFLNSYEAWTTSPVPAGAETMTKNDNVEIFTDFSRAWDRLSEVQQDILQRRYADLEEGFDDRERKALSRATNKFLDYLNQHKDIENKGYEGPGAYLTNPEAPKRIGSNAAGISAVRQHD